MRADLRQPLGELGLRAGTGEDVDLLGDRAVLIALIEEGLRHAIPSVALRAAAWLREAPLTKVIEIVVWPPAIREAWEVIAKMAVDPAQPEANRTAAWNALRRPDLIPRMMDRGEAYAPHVYTLLINLDGRVGLGQDEAWEVFE